MTTDPKPTILCVEDERDLAALIADDLSDAGMYVQCFHRKEPVIDWLGRNFANLVLLDVSLPDGTGFEILREMRQKGMTTPVIFLTGNIDEADRVQGLDLGADDYIAKPFSFPELRARIRAVLRRSETSRDAVISGEAKITDEPFDFCGASVDPPRMRINFPNGKTENIGSKELGIIHFMTRHVGTVVTRRALVHAVWGIHANPKSRSVDQYIVKIRTMLSENGCSDTTFRTIHGVGYFYDG